MTTTPLAFDTEAYLIGKGAVAPKMVCVSLASVKEGTFLIGNGDDHLLDSLRSMFTLGTHLLVGHNVAFDSAVVATAYPELEEMIWAKYAAGEIVCTIVQEYLINLSTHGKLDSIKLPDGTSEKIRYTLARLETNYIGIDRSATKIGDDQWRLNYHRLDGEKAENYPRDAADYAMDDAHGTLQVYVEQLKKAPKDALETAPFHAYADFALFLITCRGMAIDAEEVERVKGRVAEELTPDKLQVLVDAGILNPGHGPRPHSRQTAKALEILGKTEVPKDWDTYRVTLEAEGIKFAKGANSKVNTKPWKELIEKVSKKFGVPIKRTPKGAVSTDVEVLEDLQGLDPVIDAYRDRQALQKIITTEIPRMEWEGEISDIIHFPYRVLVETGRTSSRASKLFPSGNGQQIDPRVRPCYKAREGHVLLSTDYSTLELATVGQGMIDLFGTSVHADKINAGQDLHAFLAARLAFELNPDFRETCDEMGLSTNDEIYSCFMACKTHKSQDLKDFYKWWRKFAKPVGLGYPGGLGPWTFISLAKKSYGVNIAEIASTLSDDQFQVSKYLLNICKKNLGIEAADFTWTPQTKAVALAIKLKEIWLDTFLMRPYYEHINNNQKDSVNPVIGMNDDGKPKRGYSYTSPFGMIRRGCSYTSVCNGLLMQTPAAEGFKVAIINVTRACRDSSIGSILYKVVHPLNEIHDELITEHKDDKIQVLHDQSEEVSRIMLDAMALITPDITGLRTEGVYMRVWDKYADPTFDDQGRLIVTETVAPSK